MSKVFKYVKEVFRGRYMLAKRRMSCRLVSVQMDQKRFTSDKPIRVFFKCDTGCAPAFTESTKGNETVVRVDCSTDRRTVRAEGRTARAEARIRDLMDANSVASGELMRLTNDLRVYDLSNAELRIRFSERFQPILKALNGSEQDYIQYCNEERYLGNH